MTLVVSSPLSFTLSSRSPAWPTAENEKEQKRELQVAKQKRIFTHAHILQHSSKNSTREPSSQADRKRYRVLFWYIIMFLSFGSITCYPLSAGKYNPSE